MNNFVRNNNTGATTGLLSATPSAPMQTGAQPLNPPTQQLPNAPQFDFTQAQGDRSGFGTLLKVTGQAPMAAQWKAQASNARMNNAYAQRNADRSMQNTLTRRSQGLQNKGLNITDRMNQMLSGMHQQQMDEERLRTQRDFNEHQAGTYNRTLGPEAQGITDPVAAKRYSDFMALNHPELQNATPQQMKSAQPLSAQQFGVTDTANRGAILPGTTTQQDATTLRTLTNSAPRELNWGDVHRDPSGTRHWYNALHIPTIWGDKDEVGMLPFVGRKLGGMIGMDGVDKMIDRRDASGRIRQTVMGNTFKGAPGYGSGGGIDTQDIVNDPRRDPVHMSGSPNVDPHGEVQYPAPSRNRGLYNSVGSGFDDDRY